MESVFVFTVTATSLVMCLWWQRDGAFNMVMKSLMGAQAFVGGYLIYTLRMFG